MIIDGIGFKEEWAKTKTEAQFVAEFSSASHIYPVDKEARLKKAYALLHGQEPAEEISVVARPMDVQDDEE